MYCSQISDLISSIIIYLCGFVLFIKYAINRSLDRHDEKQAQKKKSLAATPEESRKGGDK